MQLTDLVSASNTRWTLGDEIVARGCSVHLVLQDVCSTDPEDAVDILDGDGGTSTYQVRPIGITGIMDIPTKCSRDDDDTWLTAAVKDSQEYALSTALVTEPPDSQFFGGGKPIWLGSDGVRQQVYTGTTGESFALAVGAARTIWYQHNIPDGGTKPLLHVSPMIVPVLCQAGLLHVTATGELITCWGNDVIASPGYDAIVPGAFWTPKFDIKVTDIESTGLGFDHRINRVNHQSSFVALVDLAPCSIVRVLQGVANDPALPDFTLGG